MMKQWIIIISLFLSTTLFGQVIEVSKDTLKFERKYWDSHYMVSDSVVIYNKGNTQLRISSIETFRWWEFNLTYIHENKTIRTGVTRRGSSIFPIDILPKDSIKLIVQFVMHVTKSVNTLQYFADSLFFYSNSINKNKLAIVTLSDYAGVGVEEEKALPNKIHLYQNYPNPFNPKTIIMFSLSNSNYVSLEVYDLLGRRITELVNKYLTPGYYEIQFEGNDLASGIYYYKLNAGIYSQSKKMLLLK